jgi:hypothetical protein
LKPLDDYIYFDSTLYLAPAEKARVKYPAPVAEASASSIESTMLCNPQIDLSLREVNQHCYATLDLAFVKNKGKTEFEMNCWS